MLKQQRALRRAHALAVDVAKGRFFSPVKPCYSWWWEWPLQSSTKKKRKKNTYNAEYNSHFQTVNTVETQLKEVHCKSVAVCLHGLSTRSLYRPGATGISFAIGFIQFARWQWQSVQSEWCVEAYTFMIARPRCEGRHSFNLLINVFFVINKLEFSKKKGTVQGSQTANQPFPVNLWNGDW